MNAALWTESFRIAFREMLRHRTRSILTMFGVIIGVGAIIAVVSISEGAKQRIQGQIANLGTNMIIVLPGTASDSGARGAAGSAPTLTLEDARAIERDCSAVAYCAPVARIVCQAVSELANWTVPVFGSTASYLSIRGWPVVSGRSLEPADDDTAAKVCVIGATTAEQLFGDLDPIGLRIRVKGTMIEIVGLLERKGQSPMGEDQDDTLVIPISTVFRQLAGGDRPHALVASAVHESQVELAMNQMRELLRQRHRLNENEPDDFAIKSIEEYARMAEATSNVMRTLLVSIAAISLLVGGIGIMNIMLVSVTERTREIGLRKALGARYADIMYQFLIESVVMTVSGGAAGVALGIGASMLITVLAGWAVKVSAASIALATLFSIVVGLVFGVWPARRAASLNPIEALRYE